MISFSPISTVEMAQTSNLVQENYILLFQGIVTKCP